MMSLVDLALVGAVGGAVGLALRAIVSAARHPLRRSELVEEELPAESRVSPARVARLLIAAPAILLLIMISREVRTSKATALVRQEAEAAYVAAAQPGPPPSEPHPENKSEVGYVYLGQCHNGQWTPKADLFGNLPSRCDEEIPAEGRKIVSWGGAIIRATPPVKVNGKTQFGEEVARVGSKHAVVLRKMFSASVFTNGPHFYWGLIDLPAHPPKPQSGDEP